MLAAALLAGIAEWSRDTGAEHAIDRVQFDQPIGVNQAIKHPCADMAVQAQLAYAQSLFAALAIDEGRLDAEFQALSARITAAAAADFATAATLQMHGRDGLHARARRPPLRETDGAPLAHASATPAAWLERLLELPEPV